ncbi:efflux RND transporter periplasmic adaptor subunit [Aquabacterium sp. J223]|uniref:efflux RND transporter periplasmic adaptor subunit n=1 Tax=Aquabacterium sp. J223 TaxID=2898431 RepID=UPI0021ADEA9A|nr:efflux RND transporter periplasmic adaptor subunit [Aquabacterium sp. J223]UUX95701.1 efflux RND transporter periplasmic adaptor subunit [Aquabacterium sp. J223]
MLPLLLGPGLCTVALCAPAAAPQRVALTVTTVQPQVAPWPLRLPASGDVAAWQEAVVGPEVSGLRVAELRADVGDRVRRGQVLARLDAQTVQTELAQTRAALTEAEATLAEAQANADRARALQGSGALSPQQIAQYLAAEQSGRARLASAQARVRADELRLARTEVRAPDDGIVATRSATVGAISQPGQELFRLIRRGRLEWRAELPAADLGRLKPGVPARIGLPSGQVVEGRVRQLAPTVDVASRNGRVYVDLPPTAEARPGLFVRGEFDLGQQTALTLPQSAVLLREGFAYVFVLGDDQRVRQTKVSIGRREGERVEVTGGLTAQAQVVERGVGFLADGDPVRRVAAPAAAASAPASSPATR